MKIVIVGAGAVGLNYGLRLLERELFDHANLERVLHEVFFLVRCDYDIILQHGIRFHCNDDVPIEFGCDVLNGKVFRNEVDLVRSVGKMDLIIVAVKSYSLTDEFIRTLIHLSDANSKFLVIMNGLGMEEKLAKFLPRSQIFGAVTFIGCNRLYNTPNREEGPIIIRNFNDNRLEMGHLEDDETLVHELLEVWSRTRIADLVAAVPNLLATRWSKLCWNITFSGLAVAMGGITVDIIDQDPSLHSLADMIMKETMEVAQVDVYHQYVAKTKDPVPRNMFISPFPEVSALNTKLWLGTSQLGPYKTSTVLDLVENRDIEVEHLFTYPLQRAHFLVQHYPDLHFSHLESIVMMVEGIQRLQKSKRSNGESWPAVSIPR